MDIRDGSRAIEPLDMLYSEREIARLVAGFAFRDQQRWEDLCDLFWGDAHLSISWFSGSIAEFVSQSRSMAANPAMRLKHVIGQPKIECVENRATGDTDICIMVRAPIGDSATIVDVTTWARFVDRFERRNGTWKIVRRVAVYDKDRADPWAPGTLIKWRTPVHVYSRFPEAYRNLATMLSDLGRKEMRAAIVSGTSDEQELLAAQHAWLHENQCDG